MLGLHAKNLCTKALTLGWESKTKMVSTIELRQRNATLSNFLRPPHPSLSPDYGGEDKGEGV